MNKEQQSLDELRDLVHSELDGTRMLNEYLKHCDTLQELVDKATPKKPEYLNYGGYKLGNYHCPNCNSIIIIDNRNSKLPKHCDECDQLLDWSDEDDK